MKLDFSHHRLNSEEELKPYIKQTFRVRGAYVNYWKYAESLYRRIVYLAPGEEIDVDNLTRAENRDVFIKTLCAFMISGIAWNFKFNNTYTKFYRCSDPIKQTKENKLKITQQ